MFSATDGKIRSAVEALHLMALCASAIALMLGLLVRSTVMVNVGVSLLLLLPPLRLATTIIGEARGRRYGIASMGVLVLAFILISRRIS